MRSGLSAMKSAAARQPSNAAAQLTATLQTARGLRLCVVMVNESIVYERQLWARDDEDALQRACAMLQQRRTRGWREVGRVLRNLRTRRP